MKKLLSLLLSAVMLLTLVTPAFAEGWDSHTPGYEVNEGVAEVTSPDDFRYAMEMDESVTEVVIPQDNEVRFDFDESNQQTLFISKTLRIEGGAELFVQNTFVQATADIRINEGGRLVIKGSYAHYTELTMECGKNADSVPTLINNGELRMEEMSGVMLVNPCAYDGEQENITFADGGEFKYADRLDFQDEDFCYEDSEFDITSPVSYGEETGNMVLRTALVWSENGLRAAIESDRYNSGIQTQETIRLMKKTQDEGDEELRLPCSLMTNFYLTVGEGVALYLADAFNQFNAPVTVNGSLFVNSCSSITFFNDALTVGSGGLLFNGYGSELDLCGYVTVSKDGQLNNEGHLCYCPSGLPEDIGVEEPDTPTMNVVGEVISSGVFENRGDIFIGGNFTVPDKEGELTYRDSWENLTEHALFNRRRMRIKADGELVIGGAMQNNGIVEVNGKLTVCSTESNNLQEGVANGALKNFHRINVIQGEFFIMDPEPNGDPAKFGGVFVNIGEFRLPDVNQDPGPMAILSGPTYNYGQILQERGNITIYNEFYNERMDEPAEIIVKRGEFFIHDYGRLYNNGGNISISGDTYARQRGYVRNDGEITVEGERCEYEITPESLTADNYNDGNCEDQQATLCNNNELIVRDGGCFKISADTYRAILHNNGTIRNENGRLELSGMLRNFNRLRNDGEFTVNDGAVLENYKFLLVGDSASFADGGNQPITWGEGANAEDELVDYPQLRLAKVFYEDDNTRYELINDIWSVKGDCLEDIIVVDGHEYSGDWKYATAEVSFENYKYNRNGDRDDQNGTLDETEHIRVTPENEGERYRIEFVEWGETRAVLSQEIVREQGETGGDELRVHTYDAGVDIDYAGFYYTNELLDRENNLNENSARGAAVYGRCYCYNTNDELWLMKRGDGMQGSREDILKNFEVCLNDEPANIEEAEDGWFRVYRTDDWSEDYTESCVLMLRPEWRGNSDRFDIHLLFPEGGEGDFELRLRYEDVDAYLGCRKPVVRIGDAAGFKGGEVTVDVCADNFPGLLGYQLQLAFDTDKLKAKSVSVAGDRYADSRISNEGKKGTVFVALATEDDNPVEGGVIFSVTFEIQPGGESAVEDIPVYFDDAYNQKMIVGSGKELPLMDASYCGGVVQTLLAGDVYRDGEIDIRDAVQLLRGLTGKVELTAAEYEAGLIVAGEDMISANGVLAILSYLAKGGELQYKPAQ